MATRRKRVLAVDDDPTSRAMLDRGLAQVYDVELAENGAQALTEIRRERPDLVLMDLRMPVMDEEESTRLIREQLPETRVLILTTFDDDEDVIEARKLGAAGYILKDIPPEELISSIRAAHEGRVGYGAAGATTLRRAPARTGTAFHRRDAGASRRRGAREASRSGAALRASPGVRDRPV